MVKLRRTMASALLLGLTAGGDLSLVHEGVVPRLGLQEERVNPQAKVLQDFQDRVKTYMELRKQAAGDSPKMEETKDAGKIVAAQDGLAARIRQARANAKRLGLAARFVKSDLFATVPRRLAGSVDVITFHPPYVPMRELKDLPEEIREWEPAHTLTDRSVDGLGLITRTAREAPDWLSPQGWLLVEVSPDRVREVKKVLGRAGFREMRRTKGGPIPLTRVIVAKRPA